MSDMAGDARGLGHHDEGSLAAALEASADRLLDEGRPHEALAALTESVTLRRRLVTNDVATYNDLAVSVSMRGHALSESGDWEQARDAAAEATALNRILAATRTDLFLHSLVVSLYNQSLVMINLERLEEALSSTREALGLIVCAGDLRSSAGIGLELARYYIGLSDELGHERDAQLEAALADLLTASGVTEGGDERARPDISEDLARLQADESEFRARGDEESALAVLDRMLEIDPSFSPALNNKGALLAGQNRFYEAIPALEASLAADPSNAVAHNNLALCLIGTGRHERALDELTAAWEGGYRHDGVIYNAGMAMLHLGRLAEAIPYLEGGIDAAGTPGTTRSFLRRLRTVLGVHADVDDPQFVTAVVAAVERLAAEDIAVAQYEGTALTLRLRIDGSWHAIDWESDSVPR
jgi:tetratricopeptide (TPR) repeat protein